jgi:hypothetical protein
MRNINPSTAKKLCDDGDLDGAVIFGFRDGLFVSTSWGTSPSRHDHYKGVLEQIHNRIESGEIEI